MKQIKMPKYTTLCMLGAMLSASAISIISAWQTSNIITGILVIVLYYFYRSRKPEKKNDAGIIRMSMIVGIIWALFMTLKGLECFDNYPSIGIIGKISIVCCILVGFSVLFFYLIHYLYGTMQLLTIQRSSDNRKIATYKVFLICFIVILLCWLPYYFAYFPGAVISDSCDQINQALTGNYSNHHPVVQTWMIQGVIHIGMQLFGDLNASVALYCVLQMLVLAAIYAYTVSMFYQCHIRIFICILILGFYAVIPYNVMFSINMWKDTAFSAFVLLFSLILWKILKEPREKRRLITMGELVLLLVSGLGICLFRNNGFYAFLLVLPFVCIICHKKYKQVVVTMVAIFTITLLVKGPVFDYFQVASADLIESLSIPAQQIARVVSDDLELSDEQSTLLNQIIDLDKVADTYDERISDPIKNLVRSYGKQEYLEEHKTEYLRLWLEIGLQYPFQYIRAYSNQTEGYWNPDVQRWVYVEDVFDTQLGIYEQPLLSKNTAQQLKWIAWDTYQEIPIYGILWSIGAAVWLAIFLAGYCYATGKKREICIFLPMAALWGTIMLATPVYAEFRYIYAIFLCTPLYLVASVYRNEGEA